MKVKVCGITNISDAQDAISLGVNALGVIFYDKSERFVSFDQAAMLFNQIPTFVSRVGVFVNAPIEEVNLLTRQCQLDYVQLHGEESVDYCLSCDAKVIKAFRVSSVDDLSSICQYQGVVNAILLDTKMKDTYGGTGLSFDWGIAISAKDYGIPLILSGGINSSNINKAIELVQPYAVDVNSSVETSPGKKDYNKMKTFFSFI